MSGPPIPPGLIEPDALGDVRPHPDVVAFSIAISLRRIANDASIIRTLLSQIEMNTRSNQP